MPTTPYAYVTLAQVRQSLAQRLYDATQTFFSPAELTLYIADALRTWNALTSYWRDDFEFKSIPNVQWYDLTDPAIFPNTLRRYTVTDVDLYVLMQYGLLEPPVGINPWTGSTQFSASDFTGAVQRRRDEILSVTGCTYTRFTVPAVPGRTVLSDQVIDVRRIAFQRRGSRLYGIGKWGAGPYGTGTGTLGKVMWPEDRWAMQAFQDNYKQQPAGVPLIYMMSTDPPISFDTDKPPLPGGVYELLTISAGAGLSATTPQLLSLPDDWTHVARWGALADLLGRESNAKDTLRAAYCEKRYAMGLRLLTIAPALLALEEANIGRSLEVDSVREADLYNTDWQSPANAATPPAIPYGGGGSSLPITNYGVPNYGSGNYGGTAQFGGTGYGENVYGGVPGTAAQNVPRAAYYAGLNLVALAPLPGDGPFSFVATTVRNAPIPATDGDFVQVSRGDLDAIIDYAQHVATFKLGGAEFLATMPLFQRFLDQASEYGLKLTEMGEFTKMLLGLAAGEEQFNPRLSIPETDAQ